MTEDHSDLQVPGYRIEGRLPRGASGRRVWFARSAAGEPVALRLLDVSGDLAERDRLRRRLAGLTAFDHPHVARLRTVVTTARGLVLVHDCVEGERLAEVLAAGRRLSAGQLVTLAAPLAQALAALHAAGEAHGALSVDSVLIDAGGRPVLVDVGVGCWRAAAAPGGDVAATPAGDVAAMAGLCAAAVAPIVPAAVTDLVAAAQHAEPSRRPSATEFAAALLAACQAEPLPSAPGDASVGDCEAKRLPGQPPHLKIDPGSGDLEGLGTPRQPPRLKLPSAGRERGPARRQGPDRGRGGTRWRGRERKAAAPPPRARRHRAPQRVGVLLTLPVLVLFAAGAGVVWAEATRGPQSRHLHAVAPEGLPTATTRQGAPATGSARASEPSSRKPSLAERPSPKPETTAPSRPESSAGSRSAGWRAVLAELDRRRVSAFAATDAAALRRVYQPGSPPLARDLRRLAALRAAGARAERLRLAVVDVRPLLERRQEVVLRVVDRMRPYSLVGADGTVLERRAGRGPMAWTLRLQWNAAHGWRIAGVTRAVAE